MTWITKFLHDAKIKSLYETSKIKLEYLSMEHLNSKATKSDKKHWDIELEVLEQYVRMYPEKLAELKYYKYVYNDYIKKVYCKGGDD